MRIAEIKFPDIANGPGCRISIFLQGCHRHCKGCFNQSTWDPNGGRELDSNDILDIGSRLSMDYTAGLSILGGEPLEQVDDLTRLLKSFKEVYPDKTIWLYTGNTYEDVKDLEVFKYVDVVVDGAFVEDLKDISLVFRGSSNQRIIHLDKEENKND